MKIFFLKEEKTENKYFEHLLLQRARECSGIKQKKKKKSRERESRRKKERWRFQNEVESRGKKKDGDIWVYMCDGEKKEKKMKNEINKK